MDKGQAKKSNLRKQLWLGKAENRAPLFRSIVLAGIALILIGSLLSWNRFSQNQSGTSKDPLPLRISEVQSDNEVTLLTADGSAPDWIEIENTGSAPVSLKGISMAVDAKVNKVFTFPDIDLDAGEFLLVYADGGTKSSANGELHAPFKLPASGGTTLVLMESDNQVLDSVNLPELDVDTSYCRVDADNWEISLRPTPGARNEAGAQGGAVEVAVASDIEFTEAMSSNSRSFPDENGEYSDYIELHNSSNADINLEGYWLSDEAEKLRKWEFPAVTLPAGGHLALHCSGYDRSSDPAHLHTNFKLSREGEHIYLSNPKGEAIAKVDLPQLESGQAYSYFEGAWTTQLAPTPNQPNSYENAAQANGRSLSALQINEIMASPETETCDWVELYNGGTETIDLSNCGLSDDLKRPRKWQFPQNTMLGPQQYLVVLCANSETNVGSQAAGYLRAPFNLSASGGYSVCLSSPDGSVIDSIYLPGQSRGISYGRSMSGECGYLSTSTPFSQNSDVRAVGTVKGARYSVPGGLYTTGDSFSVELSAEEGARIYYTLDCTDPTEASTLYTGTPIPVSSTTILRTRVYKDGCLPSIMDTQSYLYDVRGAGEVSYVVSLVSDPNGLYSDTEGIMVKGPNAWEKFPYGDYGEGANFWMNWERESHIELFAASGETAISQECGIKIHGRNSRAYPLKAFKVFARSRYGDSTFSYPIFSDRSYDEYGSFILRYTGQDYKYAFMRDPVLVSLAENTSILYQEAEECICYLNGQYYSAMYIREHLTPEAICRAVGWEGREDDIDLVKGGYNVMQGSNDTYAELKEWLKTHDATTQEAYEKIDSIVDIDNFIEFMALQLVIAPPDTVNVKRYRDPDGDGKWRWVIYDVDRGMREDIDTFALLAQGTNAGLFMACMQNPTIRQRFLEYFDEALGTYLSSESIMSKVLEQYDRLQPVLPQYLEMVGVSRDEYESHVKSLKRMIAKRPSQVIVHCCNYLGISKEECPTYFPRAIAAIEAYSNSQ